MANEKTYNKKNGTFKTILTLFLAFSLCFVFCGCTQETDEVQNIKCESFVYASFESTIHITSRESVMGDERAVFKSTIQPKDITLLDALVGKEVKAVTFIDEHNIKVVLDGKTTALNEPEEYGKVVISKNALSNDANAFDYVFVKKAYMSVESLFTSSNVRIATLALPVGNFTEYATKEYIRLAEGFDGEITEIILENGKLIVKVKGATSAPTLVIDAQATTFNKGVAIPLVSLSKAIME